MEKYIVEAGAFEIGYADLKSGPIPILDLLVKLFKHTKHTFEVAGHTANNTSDSYNVEISTRRAESVIAYLTFRGIDRTRMSAIGHGASSPVASNSTAPGRELNRRVEVTVALRGQCDISVNLGCMSTIGVRDGVWSLHA